MIRVGSRLPVRCAAGVVLALAGATVLAAPAHARSDLSLVAETTVVQDGPSTVSDVRWTLPAEAAPGDTVELFLPEHAGGAAGADWISSTGAMALAMSCKTRSVSSTDEPRGRSITTASSDLLSNGRSFTVTALT